ncbi:MAG: AraC family transcriptional regulator [Leptolyngbya sp. SIO4C5]|nr:AraC family transcriptional regulator [Leptolyngbya sp. SIO4C5]
MHGILAAAERADLPVGILLKKAGLTAEGLADADSRLPHAKLAALWQAIAQVAPDPCIGAMLAELTELEAFNVTGYAMTHSPTLAKALDRLVRYSRLLHEGLTFALTVEAKTACLTHRAINPTLMLPAISGSWTLANLVLWARRSLGDRWSPISIRLQQVRPLDLSVYQRVFKADLAFSCAENSLVFDADWLEAPLVNANPGLCDLLDRYAETLLSQLPQSDTVLNQIRHLMTVELRGREPRLEAIAQKLGYSPRTLQRKLEQANTSFQQLLDEMRRELAFQYLRDPQLTTSEIAFLLGFSENSAFNRAFRRWTGHTPGEFRLACR